MRDGRAAAYAASLTFYLLSIVAFAATAFGRVNAAVPVVFGIWAVFLCYVGDRRLDGGGPE